MTNTKYYNLLSNYKFNKFHICSDRKKIMKKKFVKPIIILTLTQTINQLSTIQMDPSARTPISKIQMEFHSSRILPRTKTPRILPSTRTQRI